MSKIYKSLPVVVTNITDEGVVEAYVNTFGIVDSQKDIIHNGAFRKTIMEHGHKVRVLDSHKTDSVTNVVGKCLEVREVGREELPLEIVEKFPEATGALFTKTQYAIETDKGLQVFKLIQGGYINEYSVGIDVHDKDMSVVKGERVRNIRTAKLWEYSPVIWGANPATQTASVKEDEVMEESSNTFADMIINHVLMYFNDCVTALLEMEYINREQYILGLQSLGDIETSLLDAIPSDLASKELPLYSSYAKPSFSTNKVEEELGQTAEVIASTYDEKFDEMREALRLSITNFKIGEL